MSTNRYLFIQNFSIWKKDKIYFKPLFRAFYFLCRKTTLIKIFIIYQYFKMTGEGLKYIILTNSLSYFCQILLPTKLTIFPVQFNNDFHSGLCIILYDCPLLLGLPHAGTLLVHLLGLFRLFVIFLT